MDILERLTIFLKDLKIYREKITDEEFNEKLKRNCGALKKIIIELTGSQYFQHGLGKYDMWTAAFNPLIGKKGTQEVAITFCIDAINETIGILEFDIEKGVRDKETGELIIYQEKCDLRFQRHLSHMRV